MAHHVDARKLVDRRYPYVVISRGGDVIDAIHQYCTVVVERGLNTSNERKNYSCVVTEVTPSFTVILSARSRRPTNVPGSYNGSCESAPVGVSHFFKNANSIIETVRNVRTGSENSFLLWDINEVDQSQIADRARSVLRDSVQPLLTVNLRLASFSPQNKNQ